MRIPWIQDLNERRRQRREERKEQRQIERLTNAYANFDKQFAQSFGLPFNLAVRAAIAPFMEVLVREALPDILAALCEGNPSVNGGSFSGQLVACLDGSHGAHWGPAPESGEPNRSAFHASLVYDTEKKEYTITMLEGYAQVVGYSLQHVAGGAFTSKGKNWFCWLVWTQSTDSWSLQSANAQPQSMGGDLNVPLWKFTWAADGAGELVQFVEGAILIVMTINALDVDSIGSDV